MLPSQHAHATPTPTHNSPQPPTTKKKPSNTAHPRYEGLFFISHICLFQGRLGAPFVSSCLMQCGTTGQQHRQQTPTQGRCWPAISLHPHHLCILFSSPELTCLLSAPPSFPMISITIPAKVHLDQSHQ